MKKCLPAAAVAVALLAALPAQAEDLLTGDVRLACEAVLCLSSGDRPHECAASLKRYFSIKHKRPHKTLRARQDFLDLCPSGSEKDKASPQAVAGTAGR